MYFGSNSRRASMVSKTLSMLFPFSGGSTSKENAVRVLFLIISATFMGQFSFAAKILFYRDINAFLSEKVACCFFFAGIEPLFPTAFVARRFRVRGGGGREHGMPIVFAEVTISYLFLPQPLPAASTAADIALSPGATGFECQ